MTTGRAIQSSIVERSQTDCKSWRVGCTRERRDHEYKLSFKMCIEQGKERLTDGISGWDSICFKMGKTWQRERCRREKGRIMDKVRPHRWMRFKAQVNEALQRRRDLCVPTAMHMPRDGARWAQECMHWPLFLLGMTRQSPVLTERSGHRWESEPCRERRYRKKVA